MQEDLKRDSINTAANYSKMFFVFTEMRQRFDQGEDPLDPEEQQQRQQWGNPFGFNPFGGGGGNFNFKFNFN